MGFMDKIKKIANGGNKQAEAYPEIVIIQELAHTYALSEDFKRVLYFLNQIREADEVLPEFAASIIREKQLVLYGIYDLHNMLDKIPPTDVVKKSKFSTQIAEALRLILKEIEETADSLDIALDLLEQRSKDIQVLLNGSEEEKKNVVLPSDLIQPSRLFEQEEDHTRFPYPQEDVMPTEFVEETDIAEQTEVVENKESFGTEQAVSIENNETSNNQEVEK